MEGTRRLPGARAAEYKRDHPETVICCVEGTWHAWIPAAGRTGTELHARDEDELLDRLAAEPPAR